MVSTNDEKLMFYSLYKQATKGKNKKPQPGFLNFVEKAKWFLFSFIRFFSF